jgi:broad specificity phosphatase PhoE
VLRVFSNREAPHGLTDLGRKQVQALADKLSGMRFAAFYASPILRARESASILSERLGIPFDVSEALREYEVGELEGRSDDAAWAQYHELHAAWLRGAIDVSVGGGESFRQICARFQPLLNRIRAREVDGNVLLLGHGGTFYCVLSHLCSNLEASFVFERGLGHTDVVVTELTAGGLSCVSWGDSRM